MRSIYDARYYYVTENVLKNYKAYLKNFTWVERTISLRWKIWKAYEAKGAQYCHATMNALKKYKAYTKNIWVGRTDSLRIKHKSA